MNLLCSKRALPMESTSLSPVTYLELPKDVIRRILHYSTPRSAVALRGINSHFKTTVEEDTYWQVLLKTSKPLPVNPFFPNASSSKTLRDWTKELFPGADLQMTDFYQCLYLYSRENINLFKEIDRLRVTLVLLNVTKTFRNREYLVLVDGNDFRIFRHYPTCLFELSCKPINDIELIVGLSDSRLYYLTSEGLYSYNIDTATTHPITTAFQYQQNSVESFNYNRRFVIVHSQGVLNCIDAVTDKVLFELNNVQKYSLHKTFLHIIFKDKTIKSIDIPSYLTTESTLNQYKTRGIYRDILVCKDINHTALFKLTDNCISSNSSVLDLICVIPHYFRFTYVSGPYLILVAIDGPMIIFDMKRKVIVVKLRLRMDKSYHMDFFKIQFKGTTLVFIMKQGNTHYFDLRQHIALYSQQLADPTDLEALTLSLPSGHGGWDWALGSLYKENNLVNTEYSANTLQLSTSPFDGCEIFGSFAMLYQSNNKVVRFLHFKTAHQQAHQDTTSISTSQSDTPLSIHLHLPTSPDSLEAQAYFSSIHSIKSLKAEALTLTLEHIKRLVAIIPDSHPTVLPFWVHYQKTFSLLSTDDILTDPTIALENFQTILYPFLDQPFLHQFILEGLTCTSIALEATANTYYRQITNLTQSTTHTDVPHKSSFILSQAKKWFTATYQAIHSLKTHFYPHPPLLQAFTFLNETFQAVELTFYRKVREAITNHIDSYYTTLIEHLEKMKTALKHLLDQSNGGITVEGILAWDNLQHIELDRLTTLKMEGTDIVNAFNTPLLCEEASLKVQEAIQKGEEEIASLLSCFNSSIPPEKLLQTLLLHLEVALPSSNKEAVGLHSVQRFINKLIEFHNGWKVLFQTTIMVTHTDLQSLWNFDNYWESIKGLLKLDSVGLLEAFEDTLENYSGVILSEGTDVQAMIDNFCEWVVVMMKQLDVMVDSSANLIEAHYPPEFVFKVQALQVEWMRDLKVLRASWQARIGRDMVLPFVKHLTRDDMTTLSVALQTGRKIPPEFKERIAQYQKLKEFLYKHFTGQAQVGLEILRAVTESYDKLRRGEDIDYFDIDMIH